MAKKRIFDELMDGGAAMEQYTFVRLHAREGEENALEETLREVAGHTREKKRAA